PARLLPHLRPAALPRVGAGDRGGRPPRSRRAVPPPAPLPVRGRRRLPRDRRGAGGGVRPANTARGADRGAVVRGGAAGRVPAGSAGVAPRRAILPAAGVLRAAPPPRAAGDVPRRGRPRRARVAAAGRDVAAGRRGAGRTPRGRAAEP